VAADLRGPGTALRLGERRPFIEARIVQQTIAPRMLLPRCGHLDGSLRGHLACPILSRSGPISEPNAFKRQPNDGKADANSVRIRVKQKRRVRQNYAGATRLPVCCSDDRLREITRSNPHQRWTVSRSSMISRRYASLHLRLQNLLPTTVGHHPEWPAAMITGLTRPHHSRTGRTSSWIVMTPSHAL